MGTDADDADIASAADDLDVAASGILGTAAAAHRDVAFICIAAAGSSLWLRLDTQDGDEADAAAERFLQELGRQLDQYEMN